MKQTRANNSKLRAFALGSVVWALLAVLGVVLMSVPAMSQPNAGQKASINFNIPATSLAEALNRFAEQSKLLIGGDASLTKDKQSQGLQGQFTTEQALNKLLDGSDIGYRIDSGNTVTLMSAKSNNTQLKQLSEIQVKGVMEAKESAFGPVDGYVANQSATGSKTDTPIVETPRSISILSADKIRDQRMDTVNDAFRYTPGVFGEVRGASQRKRSVLNLRGFTTDSNFMVRDGAFDFANGDDNAEPDPYLLERVEVLKGPASVLYGAASPGGIVNTVTKRPTETYFAEVELNAGSFDQYGGKFDVGGPIDKEKEFLFRLTGVANDGNAQFDFTENRRLFIAPAFTWQIGPDTSLTFLSHFQKDNIYSEVFVPAATFLFSNPNGKIGSNFLTGEPDHNSFGREGFALAYLFDHKWKNGLKFHHIFRYTKGTYFEKGMFSQGLQSDNITLNRLAFLNDDDFYSVITDNNVQFDYQIGESAHKLLAGVDYKTTAAFRIFRNSPTTPTLNVFNPNYGQALSGFGVTARREIARDQVGVYAQDQIKINRWVVTGGVRHDWAQTATDNELTDSLTKFKDTALTGQTGLTYLFENGLAPYMSYASSFELQGGTDFSGNQFEPTRGTQYELGVKYQPPSFKALATVSVFELTQSNVTTPDLENQGFSVQTGEVRSRGVEVEANAELRENVNLYASYSYTDIEVTESNSSNLGKRPVLAPDHLASLSADYKVEPGSFLSGLGLGAGIRYVGESAGDSTNSFEVPDFTLVDAAAHYDFKGDYKGMRLSVNVSNLFDKEYLSGCGNAGSCFIGSERVVTSSIRYRW